MNLDRALQIHTAALALLGALFLGLGSESPLLPIALATAAVLSLILGNIFPWLRVNKIIANLIALGAVAWSMRDFVRMGAQGQLLAIAEMLVYLQVVLLFQEKTGRVYWQLLVLSLLQVVVAAALNLGPQFGVLLAIYMGLALATLVLLCMHREWRKEGSSPPSPSASAPAWQALLAEPQQVFTAERDKELSGLARAGMIFRQAALLAAATILFATVFFCATPRIGEGPWSGPRARGGATTGFAPEVVLKEFGRVHQSRELVMRVSLTRLTDRKPVVLVGDPYFHGATLNDYVGELGGSRWLPSRRRPANRHLQPSRLPGPSLASQHAVRQDINLENPHSSIVFGLMPAQPLVETPSEVRVNQTNTRILRTTQPDEPRRDYQYSLATLAVRNGRQLHGIPHYNPNLSALDEFLLGVERADLLAIDRQRFPGLIARAEAILSAEGLESAGPLVKAEALERHFLVPDAYSYSLNMNVPRRRELDPVEDFVVHHHTGHCEYFASALVLMLRSQGIPARMIVGYKGGELNSLGMFYQVQQRHAHAWVEAWLPPGEVPPSEIAGPPSGGGTWYRLDPTPGTETGSESGEEEGPLHRMGEVFDYVELLWRDYVLSLNAARQKDTLFEPASNRAFGSLPSLAELPVLRSLAKAARSGWLKENEGQARNAGAFDWFSGIAVIVLIAFALLLMQVGLWLFQRVRMRPPGSGERATSQRARPPAFYLRLEALLARMQLRRARAQTPRELATAAAGRLKFRGHDDDVVGAPGDVVAAYYRVRFGGAALDKDEMAAIEQALAHLAPAASEKGP